MNKMVIIDQNTGKVEIIPAFTQTPKESLQYALTRLWQIWANTYRTDAMESILAIEGHIQSGAVGEYWVIPS